MSSANTLEIKRLAEKYGYHPSEITKMIKSPYEFITKVLKELELPRDLSEEEFNKVTKNFNIPSIGKLHSSYKVYKRLNKL